MPTNVGSQRKKAAADPTLSIDRCCSLPIAPLPKLRIILREIRCSAMYQSLLQFSVTQVPVCSLLYTHPAVTCVTVRQNTCRYPFLLA